MIVVAHSLLYLSYLVSFSTLFLRKIKIFFFIHFYLSVWGCEKDPLGALQRLFKSPVFVSPLFASLSHICTHLSIIHTILFIMSLYILSFYLQPFWTHKSAFCTFSMCHIFLLSCCSFIFIPLLLSFYSVFLLSLILSFPSLTWTLKVNVSVRKRRKMCEISHRDFIFCSRLECVLV